MSLRPTDENARFIWATRGRTWGFRFLRRGGLEDPLGVYEATFSRGRGSAGSLASGRRQGGVALPRS